MPRKKKLRRELRAITALVLAAGAVRLSAQSMNYDDMMVPDLTLPRLRYIKMDAEAEQNSYQSRLPGGSDVNSQRVYLSPGVGIGWDYFLYHPDLLSFSLLTEPNYNWQQYKNSGISSGSDSLLLNGDLTAQLLREKSYATTFTYNRSHDDYHYDFYNSATVDTEGWGVSTGYRDGPVPVNISFQQSHTDSKSFSQESILDQTTVNLHARNERQKMNATDLTYQFGQFNYDSQYTLASYNNQNSYHHVTLTDSEHFEKSTLSSSLLFYDVESSQSSSQNLNAGLNYSVEHTPHLRSFYNYSGSVNSGNGADSLANYGVAGIQHQLYDSLVSSLNVHGSNEKSTYGSASLDSTTIGAGGSVDYSKRLGGWGTLNLGNNANYDITDQQTSGSELLIPDESYTVPATGPAVIRLKSPRDISITSITDANHSPLDSTEYVIIQTTDPWQIQIITGGTHNLQPGSTVLVTYTIQSDSSGSYSVFSDNAHIGLRFWHERAEVYGNFNYTDNQGGASDFSLQNVTEFQAGASCDWQGIHLEGDYTEHYSTLYDYQSLSFQENYSTPVFFHSSVGVSLSQQWNIYPPGSGTSTNQTETTSFYNYMLHYDWQPVASLSWHAEIGLQQQRDTGFDENLLAARTYLNWMVGKLEFHLGYEHENQQYTAETRTRDFVFMRMRRNF
jgi:hypothetical protein